MGKTIKNNNKYDDYDVIEKKKKNKEFRKERKIRMVEKYASTSPGIHVGDDEQLEEKNKWF